MILIHWTIQFVRNAFLRHYIVHFSLLILIFASNYSIYMTIKALNILNYKGIGEINCDFSDNINVFIGGNGAGKSTILKCLSLGLNWFRARLLSAKSSASYITQDDFRRGCNEARRLHIFAQP